MADDIAMDIRITVPASVEPAADMPTKWAGGLANNATTINDRRKAKIPDSGSFQSKIAAPSSASYSPMIDSAFVSKKGKNQSHIIRSQYKNLGSSFNQWNNKLDLAFATVDGTVAKRFVDQVNNSKDNWAEAVANKTLRATGDKVRGTILGQICYWMTGDFRANQMTNNMEVIGGAPYQFMGAGYESSWKAAIMGKLVQSLILILDSDFLAAEILAQNQIINNICSTIRSGLVKTFVVGGGATDSLCQFEYSDPELKLHCRTVLI